VPPSKLVLLVVVFFLTALISVVTGSTSLITVPTMIVVGIEPHVAVATNMLALIFLSVGGSLSFKGKGVIDLPVLPVGLILTVIGSGVGAFLLLDIPTRALQLTIAVAMITVAVFSLLKRDGNAARHSVSTVSRAAGYGLTFVLAVYGGLFSGGYVTMLTAVFVFCFGLSFLQSVATTKVINIFSSLVATAIFAWREVVDYRFGAVLGVTMFVGATVGGHVAMRLPGAWLRRIFIVAVIGLAAKMMFEMLR
jgi:uncharacterized protein